jgi:hypothetical protein
MMDVYEVKSPTEFEVDEHVLVDPASHDLTLQIRVGTRWLGIRVAPEARDAVKHQLNDARKRFYAKVDRIREDEGVKKGASSESAHA